MNFGFKDEILKCSDTIKGKLIEYRRRLHRYAEVGFELTKTLDEVKGVLEKIGYDIRLMGKSGIVTQIGNGNGKTILLRADMDALPISEESGLEYAAQNGNMHA